MNSKIMNLDLDYICQSSLIDWSRIDNHSFLITGSTGLIGSVLVKSLLRRDTNIKIVLPVRSLEKAKSIFGERDNVTYLETDMEHFRCDIQTDYVIHAASPTKSKFFVTYPIETLNSTILGVNNVLDYSFKNHVKSIVYLSSMEMYGVLNADNVTETDLGYIDPLDIRSSYSEGKRVSELYCKSFYKEKNVPVKIARLAMTFGPGISREENRVYKYFCDCILKKEDIVLKSSGETVINFCYTVDAVLGILSILLNGSNGEAYNVVADPTDMTIKDSAIWLIKEYGGKNQRVIFDIPKKEDGFAPVNSMILSNEKIKKIGWAPETNLKDAYHKLLRYLKEDIYE